MTRHLYLHDDVLDDLDALWESDERAAARIEAILHELEGEDDQHQDQDLLDRLSQQNYGHPQRSAFHVRWLENQVGVGNNIWRLKIYSLANQDPTYRVIYAYFPTSPTSGTYYVLGIMRRDIDYERNDDLFRRIESTYEAIREGGG